MSQMGFCYVPAAKQEGQKEVKPSPSVMGKRTADRIGQRVIHRANPQKEKLGVPCPDLTVETLMIHQEETQKLHLVLSCVSQLKA